MNAIRSVLTRGAVGGICLWLALNLLSLPRARLVLGSMAIVLAVLVSYRFGALRRRSWRIALIEGGLLYMAAVCFCNLLLAITRALDGMP